MKKLVLDAELRAKLGGGAAKVTLTDESGNAIGHYLPDDLYQSILDAMFPDEYDRKQVLEEYQRGEYLTTEQLLASVQKNMRRWTGDPNYEF